MPLSNAERQKLYKQRHKNGGVPLPSVRVTEEVTDVLPEPVLLVTDKVTDNDNTQARLDKLERGMASLAKALIALQREVGLIRKVQKITAPDFNPEAW